jgi:PDZ domain-containing protein
MLGGLGAALAHASRRVRTLIVGGVLFVVLLIIAITVPVPYVVLSPGPTINTLGSYDNQQIIMIKGKTANKTTGNLNLTTVSISTSDVSVFQALTGWLEHDRVVVPRETIYPPGQTQKQVEQQDTEDFTTSQDNAQVAAYCQLGYPKGVEIVGTSSDMSPAKALLNGDQIVSVNGTAVTDNQSLTAVLSALTPGQEAAVVVTRAHVRQSVTVKLLAPASGKTGARVGIVVEDACFAPFDITLGLGNEIGGPSAGMMFALGIMEKVGSDDLTGGRFVAGTGTIDTDGTVGPIGGIQLKMIAARRAGATLFLAPAGNCTDVRGNIPKGLTVAKVSTLAQAVATLDAVKAGKAVAGC